MTDLPKNNPVPPPVDGLSVPDLDVRIELLDNGLEVLIHEDPEAPVASVQAWVRVGSMHEGRLLGAGVSHLVEHMLFKGTRKRGCNDIAREIQDVGGYVNAYTSFDRTVYWIDTPEEGVGVALTVLADMLQNSRFDPEDLAREQDVIRREFAMGFDDPDSEMSRLLFETAFREHPCRHPVIGHLDVFNRLTRDDVVGFYRHHYAPNRMFFSVAGPVDGDQVVSQLNEEFKDARRGDANPVWVAAEPPQIGPRRARRGFPTELTKLCWSWQTPGQFHPDVPVLDVLAATLGQGRSSRLYAKLRDGRELAHQIGSGTYVLRENGLLVVQAECDPGQRDLLTTALQEEIGLLRDGGISEKEVAKARAQALADALHELTSARGIASSVGDSWLATGTVCAGRDYLRRLNRVLAEDVTRVARTYLDLETVTEITLEPSDFPPPARLGRGRVKADEIRRVSLPNGLTLLIRADRRLPLAAVHSAFLGGLLAEQPETAGLARLHSRSLLKGAGGWSAEQLAETIEDRGGDISSGSGNNSFFVSSSVLAADWKLAVDVVGRVLTAPEFPANAVEREKKAMLAALSDRREQPMFLAGEELRRRMFGDHPYAHTRFGRSESIPRLTPDSLRGYQQQLAVGANGVVAVIGDIDPEAVIDEVIAATEGLAAGRRAFADTAPAVVRSAAEAGALHDLTLPKQQAVLVVGFPAPGLASPDRLVADLIDEACSDMASRLFNRIREEMGLAYYVGATQFIGLRGGLFYFYVGTDPGRVDEVQTVLSEEIERLGSYGLEDQELARAKRTLTSKHRQQLQTNEGLAQLVALDELYGFGIDWHRSFADRCEAVSATDVRRVADAMLARQAPVIVRVMPAG